MLELIIFHSENFASISYKKARAAAEAVQEKLGDQLGLKIEKTDSELANAYNCRGSLAVFVNQELVSLTIATSKEKMENYLEKKLADSLDNRWSKLTCNDLIME